MKRATGIILLLLVYLAAQAQPRLRQPEIYVGIHGGVLFSLVWFSPRLEGTTIIVDRTLLSGNGGLVMRYNGHKYCGFQLELNYMQRGWREYADYERRLDYLEMPWLAHIYFGKKKVRGFLNLGPQIGVLLRESSYGSENEDPEQRKQYEPIANKFDWGVAGGLGLLFRTTKVGTFQLEARFNYSLGNFYASRASDYFKHSNPMNLSINLGYLWEIKRKKNVNANVNKNIIEK